MMKKHPTSQEQVKVNGVKMDSVKLVKKESPLNFLVVLKLAPHLTQPRLGNLMPADLICPHKSAQHLKLLFHCKLVTKPLLLGLLLVLVHNLEAAEEGTDPEILDHVVNVDGNESGSSPRKNCRLLTKMRHSLPASHLGTKNLTRVIRNSNCCSVTFVVTATF